MTTQPISAAATEAKVALTLLATTPARFSVTGVYGFSEPDKSLTTDSFAIALEIYREFCSRFRIVQVSELGRNVLHHDENM